MTRKEPYRRIWARASASGANCPAIFARGALVLMPLLVGCENVEKERAKIQQEADQRIAKADVEAKQKLAAAQKQMEAMKASLAEASAKVNKATESAEEQAQVAEEAIAKARQAFKDEGRAKLSVLSKDLRELETKAAKAPAKVKAEVAKLKPKIGEAQKAIAKDISAFDTATLETFNATKAALNKDLARLKAAIAAARAKLP